MKRMGRAIHLHLLAAAVLLRASVPLAFQSTAPQAEVRAGVEELQRSNFAAAERHFLTALAADPGLAEVRANLGLAYYADHKYREAIEQFERALKDDSSLQTAKSFLPLSLAAVDRCREAQAGLEREFSSNPDVKLRRVIGLSLQRCLLETGQQAEADQVTQKLLAQYPGDVDVLYEAGQMYGKLSSEIYLRLMKLAPHSARGYQVMGQVAAADGNWQKAMGAYRQATRMDPTLPEVHLALAIQLLLHSPDPDAWKQALDELNAELKINPNSADAKYEIGEVYRKHQEPERAIAAFRQAIELRPGFVEARLELAKALRQLGRREEALAALEPARDSDNAAVHFLLSQLYRDLGRTSDAEREQGVFKRLQSAS